MARAVAHRGPDGEGVWTEGPVGFGHRRLAIRGLGDSGRQPMQDPEGRVVVTYNGELYNDAELRRAIVAETGYAFRTSCDTETLVAGWLAWGEGVFGRLEGMFAVGLWDRRTQVLVLARDAAGVKPLYLSRHGDLVAFASEIKGLYPGLEKRPAVDPAGIHTFLAQGHPGPQATLLAGVEQVPPGTVLAFDGREWRRRRFWKPVRRPDIQSVDDAADAFAELWAKVVPSLLVSEVPVGVLQSGGIDSSLVAMAVGRPGMPAFVAGFEDASHDETAGATLVARAAGATLHRVPVEIDCDAEQVFRAVVHHFDGQVADASAYAVYRLCAEVKRHVTVVLSGDGADEFFAGYTTYAASAVAHRLKPLVPAGMAAAAGRALTRLGGGDERRLPPHQLLARFLLGLAGEEPHCEWRRLVPAFLLPDLYGPSLAPLAGEPPLAGYGLALATAAGTHADRCLVADQSYYLPGDMLMKMDAMSMAHGLEVRVPFLTRAVMDLAGRMDSAVLFPRKGPPKAPLRRALERTGVPAAVTAGKKRGFNVPIDRLLRGPLRPLAERLLDREAERLAPLLAPPAVRRLWHEHRDKRRSWGYSLWPLLTLAVWLDGLDSQ